MEKLVIKRSEWLRGTTGSMLLRPSDRMKCCLGFYALSVGVATEDIMDVGNPSFVFGGNNAEKLNKLVYIDAGGNQQDTQVGIDLMSDNDCIGMSDLDRELRITELFKKIDVEVEFIP